MATRSPKSQSSRTGSRRKSSDRSAFSWSSGKAGPLIGAALAGVAVGLAANFGRKMLVQGMSGASGDWDEVLATEHQMALKTIDKMLATDSTQTWKRSMLLMKLTHDLDKHAHEEEMVVYPALREANEEHDADVLNHEHGQLKTFLYELDQMEPDDPTWLEKVRQLRGLIAEHTRMEENEVFPRFKKSMTEEQNDKVTALVNRDGFWQA